MTPTETFAQLQKAVGFGEWTMRHTGHDICFGWIAVINGTTFCGDFHTTDKELEHSNIDLPKSWAIRIKQSLAYSVARDLLGHRVSEGE